MSILYKNVDAGQVFVNKHKEDLYGIYIKGNDGYCVFLGYAGSEQLPYKHMLQDNQEVFI